MRNSPPGLVKAFRIEVETEIKRLHEFLTNWFNGTVPGEDHIYTEHCGRHLGANFLNIQPGGARLNRDQLNAAIMGGYGMNPEFRIHIRNVDIQAIMEDGTVSLATYEEFQRGAKNSPDHNARISTVLMEKHESGVGTSTFTWHHIHETWLPTERHDPALFEF